MGKTWQHAKIKILNFIKIRITLLEHADPKETGLELAKLEKAWEGMSSELAGFDEAGVADMSV